MYKKKTFKNPIKKKKILLRFLNENKTFKIIHLNIVLNYCLQFITALSIKYFIIYKY